MATMTCTSVNGAKIRINVLSASSDEREGTHADAVSCTHGELPSAPTTACVLSSSRMRMATASAAVVNVMFTKRKSCAVGT